MVKIAHAVFIGYRKIIGQGATVGLQQQVLEDHTGGVKRGIGSQGTDNKAAALLCGKLHPDADGVLYPTYVFDTAVDLAEIHVITVKDASYGLTFVVGLESAVLDGGFRNQ